MYYLKELFLKLEIDRMIIKKECIDVRVLGAENFHPKNTIDAMINTVTYIAVTKNQGI